MPVGTDGGQWDAWLHGSLDQLQRRTLMRKLRPVEPTTSPVEVHILRPEPAPPRRSIDHRAPHSPCGRYQVLITGRVLSDWLAECPGHDGNDHSSSYGPSSIHTAQLEAADTAAPAVPPGMRRLLLFSLNDYLGLSTHPDVRRAAAEAALSHGMGADPHTASPALLNTAAGTLLVGGKLAPGLALFASACQR